MSEEESSYLPGLRRDLSDRVFELKQLNVTGQALSQADIDFLIELLESSVKWGNGWMDEWSHEAIRLNKPDHLPPSDN